MKWKAWFVEGLALLIPIVLTLLLGIFLFRFFFSPVDHLITWLFPSLPYASVVSPLLSLGITLAGIILVGYLGGRWIFAKIWAKAHAFLLKIPVVRKIYHSAHEVVQIMLRDTDRGFSNVVLFPYGDCGGMVLGFLPKKESSFKGQLPILMPGTPSPLHGFLLFVKEDDLHFSSLPFEKGLKWHISLGTAPLKD